MGCQVFSKGFLVVRQQVSVQFLDAAFLFADSSYTFRVRSAMTSQDRKLSARVRSLSASSRRRSSDCNSSMMRSASCTGFLSSTQTAQSARWSGSPRSEEHTSELQSLAYLVCRLLLEKK